MQLTPARRRHAASLLDQQLWCWGWDIRRPEGNLLMQYGFERQRPPEAVSGSSYYRLCLSADESVGMWGFGLLFVDGRLGSVFLRRFGFAPVLGANRRLPERVHCPSDLIVESLPCPSPHAREAATVLTASALRWVAAYEEWIADTQPPGYRMAAVAGWAAKRKPIAAPGPEMASAWWRVAREITGRRGAVTWRKGGLNS